MNAISENNANMTLVKPDMGILLGAKLPMSSFGLLALSFSQQIADRASYISAAHPMFSLEYLNDREVAETPSVISPVLKLDFSFILDQMRKLEEAREKPVSAPEHNNTVIYVDHRQTVTNQTVYQTTNLLQTGEKEGSAKPESMQVKKPDTAKKNETPAAQFSGNAQLIRLVEKAASMQRGGWGQPSIARTAMGRDIRVITKPVSGAPGQTIRQLTAEIIPAGAGEIYYIEDKNASEHTEIASAAIKNIQTDKHVSEKKPETSHKAKAQDASSQKEQKVKDVLPEQGRPVPVAAYLPERPRNERRITPAGMWMPVDTQRAPMTSPQMEMLFSNVIRAEQEMGLTYGKADAGVPYAPQDRIQYLKNSTQLIQRREALAEAVYQIPSNALPQRELVFLQQLAEQPGTPEPVIYAAEQVVNRALELIVSAREPETIEQESPTIRTSIVSAGPEKLPIPATAEVQSAVHTQQIAAAPLELSYLSSDENPEQSSRPSETAAAAAEKQAHVAHAAKSNAVPPVSESARTGFEAAAVQNHEVKVNAAVNITEESLPQHAKQSVSAPESESKPLAAIPVMEESVQQHTAEPTAVPIIPGLQSHVGTPVELSYIERPVSAVPTETASASTTRTAPVAEHPSDAVSARTTERTTELRDIFHTISDTESAPQPQTRIKILQRLRTVFRGVPTVPEKIETAAYPPVEMIERTSAVEEQQPLLMRDEEFRNGIQLLERIVSKTMTIPQPQSDSDEVGLPRSISEFSEVYEPMKTGSLPFSPAAEIVYREHAAAQAPVYGVSGVKQNDDSSVPSTAQISRGPAEISYFPQLQTSGAASDGTSSVTSAKSKQPKLSQQRSGIFSRRDRRREERQLRKAGRSSSPTFEHLNQQPIPTSEVSPPETVFLTRQPELQASAASSAQTTQTTPMQAQAASQSENASPLQTRKIPQSVQKLSEPSPHRMPADFSEEPIYVTQTEQQTEFTERRQTIERERFSTRLKTSVVRQPTVKETVRVPQPPEIRYINAPAGLATAPDERVPVNITQEPVRQAFLKPEAMQSEYVQNLPDWAKNFLQNGYEEKAGDSGPSEPQGIPASDHVSWTNPAADALKAKSLPPQEISLKKTEDKPAASTTISESEIRRTADRVYKLIEDRLRNERRRHGW